MKSRLLVPLLLLLPAVYCGGKLAGNCLEKTIAANRDRPLLELQAQQAKELEAARRDDATTAKTMAERFVKNGLLCPATAVFPPDAVTFRYGDGWGVNSYVDSQNGFGANVRTHWKATVKHHGTEWELVDLELGK